MKTRQSTFMRLMGLLTAAALVTAGCSESTSGGTADNASDSGPAGDYSTRLVNVQDGGEPVDGGTLRVAEFSEARTMDPTTQFPTGATGGNILAAIYDTLMRYNYETDSFEPQLAESVESSDSITWTIKLREGAEFSNKTPVDADAVVASIKRYASSYGLNAALLNNSMKSIKAVDPQTVEIALKTAWPRFPSLLSSGAGMIVAPASYANAENFKPIGAGPFTFKSYAPGESTVVEANPNYWDGRPHLDAIEFVLLGSDDTAYDTLKTGGVDVAYLRNYQLVQEAVEGGVPGMAYHASLDKNLWINSRDGRPGADPRVREAIALAFDPTVFVQRATAGLGTPNKSLLGNDSTWSPGVEPLPTDPEAAKALLDEAKADGYDGTVRILCYSDQGSQEQALAIKAMLDSIGFDAQLDTVQAVADITKRTYVDHDYDIAISGTSLLDEDIFGRLYNQLNSKSPTNASGYSSPEMDKLLAELQTKADPAAAKEVLTQIEALWAKDAPGVGISSAAVLSAWSDRVHGLVPTGETSILFGQAWLSE